MAVHTRAAAGELAHQFNEHGYVVVRQLFASNEVELIRQTFTRQGTGGPVAGLSGDARLTAGEPLAKWPRMMHPHRHPQLAVGPIALRYMLDPRIESILRQLFDDEPIAAQSMFYFKPPGARGQDFHQDNFYLRVRPGTCIAAWAAIDDSDQTNGGLLVVPGSQNMEIVCPKPSDHTRFFTTEHVDIPPGLREVPVNMQAGDVLFFNGSVIHGSYPNTTSDRFRRSFICHYVPMGCVEVASWYRPLLRFDGTEVTKEVAAGGGPCGEVQAMVKGPH